MKKKILLMGLTAGCIVYAIDCIDLAHDFESSKFAQKNKIHIVQTKKITDHICQAKVELNGKLMSNSLFLTDENRSIVIEGNLFDIVREKIIKLNENISKFKKESAFDIGHGKEEYYVFSDPDCPFCKIFANIAEKMKNNATIHFFLYPQKRLHPKSEQKSFYILAEENRSKRFEIYKNMEHNNSLPEIYLDNNGSIRKALNRQIEIGKKVGVEGTPYILNSKGERVDYAAIAKKHNVYPDIFPEILKNIEKAGIPIVFGENNKDEIYYFVEIKNLGDETIRKAKKLAEKFKVLFIPYIDIYNKEKIKERILAFRYIYHKKDGKKERLLYLIENGKFEGDPKKYIRPTPFEKKAEDILGQVAQMFVIRGEAIYTSKGEYVPAQINR